jgi:hypothetical protein
LGRIRTCGKNELNAHLFGEEPVAVGFEDQWHQEFMQGFHRILILFWPLVLVMAGSLVLRNGFTGKAKEFQKKRPTCRSHCSSFDVRAEAGFARLPPDGIPSLQL